MHLRLRTQILLVALLPALLLSLVIGGYLLMTRVADLHESQQKLGEAIVSHLAPASEFAVLSGNRDVLQQLANRLVDEADVSLVRIMDVEGEVLSEAQSPVDSERPSGWATLFYPNREDRLRFESDIRIADDPIGEFEGLFAYDATTGEQNNLVIGHLVVELSAGPLMTRQAEVLRFGVLLILAGLLIASAIAMRASLNIVSPINRVVQAFRDFGNNQLDTRVSVRSRGETALLERGFNELATEIQMARERMEAQIEQSTADLRETLEAVEIQNVELDLARKRAEESNRIKSEFLANISHEIRTPMNAIFGYTQLLARTSTGDAQKDYIQTIQRSAESLLALLEDVLNLSRIEAGRVEVESSSFNLEELLEEIITIMAPSAYDKGLDLIWHPRSSLPSRLKGDPVKLRQIISNLLSNACKFTDTGSVKVETEIHRTTSDDGLLRLSIIDTGIGISQEDHRRLFQAFTQLDSSSARRHQGAGLGLVICDQLTRLMGGRITVESEPGQGSRFTIEIPIKLDSVIEAPKETIHAVCLLGPDQELTEAVAQRLGNLDCPVASIALPERPDDWPRIFQALDVEYPVAICVLPRRHIHSSGIHKALKQAMSESPFPPQRWIILASSQDKAELSEIQQKTGAGCLPLTLSRQALGSALKTIHQGRSLHPESPPEEHDSAVLHRLDGLRLMVVEDNRINRHLVLEFLQSAGAEVRTAEDGHEALKVAEHWQPDLVLMDIQLPGMDGLETSQKLRADFGFDKTPILALTASASEEEHKRCLDGGLDGVLVKPVRAEAMIDRIRRALDDYQKKRREKASPEDAVENTDASPGQLTTAPAQPMGRDPDGRLRPEIAGMVESDLPAQLDKARQYLKEGDLDGLDSEVHTMKGTAAFCGFRALQGNCETIREIIHGNADLDALSRILDAVAIEVDSVLSEIRQS